MPSCPCSRPMFFRKCLCFSPLPKPRLHFRFWFCFRFLFLFTLSVCSSQSCRWPLGHHPSCQRTLHGIAWRRRRQTHTKHQHHTAQHSTVHTFPTTLVTQLLLTYTYTYTHVINLSGYCIQPPKRRKIHSLFLTFTTGCLAHCCLLVCVMNEVTILMPPSSLPIPLNCTQCTLSHPPVQSSSPTP